MTHGELLAAASVLHEEALLHLASAEAAAATSEADLAQARERIAALEGRIALLEAILEAGPGPEPEPEPEPEPDPEPPPGHLWLDDFSRAPDDERYVRAGADPDQNFVLVPGGGMDCVFVAGKTGGPHASAATGKVLRSELMIRVPGTNNHWREEIGGTYVDEFEFTLPLDYAPAVPNETTLIYQHWQEQSVKPPVQLQLIDPAMTDDPLTLRLVLSSPLGKERRVWKTPVVRGRRYKVRLRTRWEFTDSGWMNLLLDDAPKFTLSGPTCYDVGQGMAPHLGQYLPGSYNDPVGSRTVIRFHRWVIRHE